MNRRERRIAKGIGRHQKVERAVLIHEAGHCVGRFLMAESLGWGPEEIIQHVEIYPVPMTDGTRRDVSIDGKCLMLKQATTFGQFFSKPMHEFSQRTIASRTAGEDIEIKELVFLFADMRNAGIDLDCWVLAKGVEAMFGPLAEAKDAGKSTDEALEDYSAESDLEDVFRAGTLCGMTPDDISHKLVNKSVRIAEEYIAMPQVWVSILAVADKLKPGHTPGRLITKVISRTLGTVGSGVRHG